MQKMWDVLEWALAAVSVVAVSVFLAYVLPDAKYGIAAWVQAVGSLFALGVAIYVMGRQAKHSARLVTNTDRLTALRRARSVSAILVNVMEEIKKIDQHMRAAQPFITPNVTPRAMLQNDLDTLTDLERHVTEIPAYDLGSYHLADGVLQMNRAISGYKKGLNAMLLDPSFIGTTDVVSNLDYELKQTENALLKVNKGIVEIKSGPVLITE